MKIVEFLYFYLMPETVHHLPQVSASASNTAVLGGRGRELVAAFERNRRETFGGVEKAAAEIPGLTKTTEEKQRMLGKFLSNVDDLVEDLRDSGGPFASGAF